MLPNLIIKHPQIMKTHLISLLITLFALSGTYAQNVRISGKVVDGKHEPIAFANIALQHTDSTFVTGCTSDNKGNFAMSGLAAGNYLLQVTFVGYTTQIIRLDNLNRSLDIGEIVLTDRKSVV